jgi:peptidoglycan DL-endopeptidase CwlO
MRQACVVLLTLSVGALAAAPALGDTIGSKRAEARRVLGEIQQLDLQLEKSAEAYDLATGKLDHIRAQIRTNRFELRVARHNYKRAQQLLAARLRAIYVSGDQPANSTLEILLGSKSLDEVLSSVDAVNRVSSADTSILREVRTFRADTRLQALQLKRANAAQRQVVAERAAEKASVEGSLAERQRLAASIQGEIDRLQAQEAARQAQLKAEAEARLAAQQQQENEAIQRTVVGPSAVSEGVGVAPPSQYGGAVGIAMQYLGTPYVWGGSSPGGFDCSGFVMYVYAQMGVSLPHNAGAQFSYGVPVSVDQLEPGDLVFFDGLGHVGIYIGGGQFIHSPHTGDVVKISSLSDSWYSGTYVGARRIT